MTHVRTLAAAVCTAAAILVAGANASLAGGLEITGSGGARALSLEEIAAIGATEISTTTAWTEGVQRFVGVTGSDLVQALGIDADQVVAHALNDYEVVIPFEVFAAETTLIAYERNGQPMAVRDRGPLWVVFPYDADPLYRSDTYLAYSIWNLARVTLE